MPAQLVSSPGPVKSRAVAECRVSERVACALPSSCQPASGITSKEARWAATIRDISLGGAKLNLRRRFEPGTGLAIELPGAGGGEPYTVLARVIHVRAQSDGSWLLGCQFISQLGEDEMQRLLPATAEEQAKTVANVHWQLEVRPGAIVNYRIKSLHVPPAWPVPAGKIVSLRGKGRSREWRLRLKIVTCVPRGDDWVVKCRLLAAPSAEDLLHAISTVAGRA
jgi:hypothetical protein